MKSSATKITMLLSLFVMASLLNSCLITEVNQTKELKAGETFSATLTITDVNADATAHEGVLCVLAPEDWTFESGTYTCADGNGTFNLDATAGQPIYGNLDSMLVPPAGMTWFRLVTSGAHVNAKDAIYEAIVNLKTGATTGEFGIGYMVTKNSPDLLKSINLTNQDSDAAWADTLMNVKVNVTPATSVEETNNEVVKDYVLGQNYPNPFNPTTTISFSLPKGDNVKLDVFNSNGEFVQTLVDGHVGAGTSTVKFDASNLASGIYLYKIQASDFVQIRKMMLIK